MLTSQQKAFIEFALEQGALRLGNFTLKSGRKSPYFFDTGAFSSGKSLLRLGEFYAQAIQAAGLPFDMLFGPAYKGIPLAAGVSIALSNAPGHRDYPFCCNRKERKEHGEGGQLLGSAPRGAVLILDDVLTAGTSAREAVELLKQAGATPVGLAVALDRQESNFQSMEAYRELEIIRIITLDVLIAYLEEAPGFGAADLQAIREYRQRLA